MKKIKVLCNKYREIIVYIIVGVLTTIFCWVFNWVLTLFMDANNPVINVILQILTWAAGVAFAFPLNRKWVFKSTNPNWLSEFWKFSGSRVSTGVLDVVIMLFFVNICPLTGLANWIVKVLSKFNVEMSVDDANYWFAKIFISSVLVMILNYVFSKLFVFRKKKKTEENKGE